jgi:hypothetical protein
MQHVIAREFVLERFRDNLPAVPACSCCDTKKSALETYAMAVLPFGSVLPHSEEYINNATSADWLGIRHCGANLARARHVSGYSRTASRFRS